MPSQKNPHEKSLTEKRISLETKPSWKKTFKKSPLKKLRKYPNGKMPCRKSPEKTLTEKPPIKTIRKSHPEKPSNKTVLFQFSANPTGWEYCYYFLHINFIY